MLVVYKIGSDVGGSVRIPAAFCGITSLKPTNGRIPQSGQGSDGGLVGCVGIYNSLGFMSRSAKGIADFVQVVLQKDNLIKYTPVDARFVPLPWDNMRAKPERKLKIGW
jgi:Asp-tRNA(Asn)/Glu-tRNA(Gln) amidotransferase A subunit family amidase